MKSGSYVSNERSKGAIRSGRKSINTFNIFANVVMIFTILSIVIPLYFLVITAFKSYGEAYKVPPTFVPENPTLEGFEIIAKFGADVGKALFNSLVVSFGVTSSALLFSTMAGFSFVIHRYKLKEVLFVAIILKYILPEAMLVVPWYYLIIKLGLIDNLFAIIAPNLVGAWTIFFTRSYIMQIPRDYIDAARVDGANDYQIFFRIIFPLIKPAIGVATVMNFLWSWNYFLWPLIAINSKDKFTLPLVVATVRYVYGGGGEMLPHLGALAASTLVYILPIVILYVFTQKWIVEAFTLSGIKR
ncbi:MAG: carbohydrate ABC transporter permease [Ignisphaera sp.]